MRRVFQGGLCVLLAMCASPHVAAATEEAAGPPDVTEPRLYNLTDDIGESQDLAATNPDKVKELEADWQAWNANLVVPLWGVQTLIGIRDNRSRQVSPTIDFLYELTSNPAMEID